MCGKYVAQAKKTELKPIRTIKMKKLILTGVLGVFVLGMASCGGGHTCDAYRTSDYTKYKAEKTKELKQEKAEEANK